MLFVAIVCLNDQDDTFFKLRDVLRIIPVKSVQIVPHLVVSFLVFHEQSCPQLAEIADGHNRLRTVQFL